MAKNNFRKSDFASLPEVERINALNMSMDSIQQYEQAKERVRELQEWPELDIVEQMELDRLVREMNKFKEKLSNFE